MKKFVSLLVIMVIGVSAVTMPSLIPRSASAYTAPGYNGKIAYSTYTHGNYEIYTANPDGTNHTRLTTGEDDSSNPVWSPDGTKIAYVFDRNIYIMDADGSNQTNLTNSYVNGSRKPKWSPDGTKLLFETNRSGNYDLYAINSDGSNQISLASTPSVEVNGEWSSDGSKIVFESNREGNYDIYVMDADGSNQTRLTTHIGNDTAPQWIEGDSKVLFQSTRDAETDLYAINVDGTGEQKVINTLSPYSKRPKISPSSTWFATSGMVSENNSISLLVSRTDGSEQYTYSLEEIGQEVMNVIGWSPSGDKILITGSWSVQNLYAIDFSSGEAQQITFDGTSGLGEEASWLSIPNTLPVTTTDTLTVPYQTAGTKDVLANDSDEEALSGENLSISVQPNNGTASIVDGKVRYVPNSGYQGTDSVTYQICDSFMLDQKCATGTLNITVQTPAAPMISINKVNGESFDPATNRYFTSNLRPTFSGTASPGAEIRVEIHSDPIILTTTADSDGNWSITPTFDLPAGEHMVYISATLNGATTELGAFGLTIQPSLANTGQSWRWLVGLPTGAVVLGVILLFSTRKHQFSALVNP